MLTIAVDFDGTIVKHKYPDIGEEIPFAIDTLKRMQENGCRLILWSCRTGKLLDEAEAFCKSRGLEFYAVNKNYPEESDDGPNHKVLADVYIDDRNLGGIPDWGIIYEILKGDISPVYDNVSSNVNSGLLGKLKSLLFG